MCGKQIPFVGISTDLLQLSLLTISSSITLIWLSTERISIIYYVYFEIQKDFRVLIIL